MVTARDTRRGWRRQERGGGRAPGSRRQRCVRRVAASWPLSTAFCRRASGSTRRISVCGAWRCGHRNSFLCQGRGQSVVRAGRVRTGRGGPELGGGGGGPRAEVGLPGVCTGPACGRGSLGAAGGNGSLGSQRAVPVSGNRPRRRRLSQFGPGQGQVERPSDFVPTGLSASTRGPCQACGLQKNRPRGSAIAAEGLCTSAWPVLGLSQPSFYGRQN